MDILFVIPTMRMGGAEKSLCNLLSILADSDDNVSLLLFAKEGELLEEIPEKVNVLSLDKQECAMVLEWRHYYHYLLKPLSLNKLARRVLLLFLDHFQRLLRIKKIDSWAIIKPSIATLPGEFDLAIGYLEGTADFYTLEKVSAKKKIGWVHTDFKKNVKNITVDKKYYEQFDRIATITEACKHSLEELIPSLKTQVDVVPNISSPAQIRKLSESFEPFNGESDVYHIITVGRLEDEKGIDIAIKTAASLRDSGFRFKWHVYGDGSKRKQLAEQILRFRLDNTFLLEGLVQNPYPYMRCCDVLVQPSRYEGKSIVLDEAKILCKPIIVTNYPSAKDQVKNGETGIICDYRPESIAKEIMRVCLDKDVADVLKRNCRSEAYSNPKGIEAFSELIKRTL